MALDGSLVAPVQTDPLTRMPEVAVGLAALQERLGHVFRDPGLLVRALTHVGGATDRRGSYQRLEFLGDRVLGLVVSGMLYAEFPDADEGELSRRLADLVRRESCAAVASDWDVEGHVRLGAGEKSSATLRRAILGDLCESIIGAVYLDGGFAAAEGLVSRSFSARMLSPNRSLRDPKTALQEWAQAKTGAMPAYRVVERSGPDHAPEFTVAVSVVGREDGTASGPSKRIAEQAAAAAFLLREGVGEGDRP